MTTKTSSSPLARIPKVDKLLAEDAIQALATRASRPSLVEAVRTTLEDLRMALVRGTADEHDFEVGNLAARVEAHLQAAARPYYRRVVNATGVILHTGIGRAVLPKEAVAALAELSIGSQRLEIDLETGDRGGRDEGCAALLRKITGCQAATVVNNNAAATILILAALTHGRKAIVSRGELVEIGGSFRIPEVMEQSGAILSEVGATNRTHLEDYRRALDAETGMLLKVHTSNYRIVGFTGEVEIEELAALGREAREGREKELWVVHDLGSGCVVDLAQKGLRGESLVQRSLAAGADLVCFSGDKLLGGPQAGIIAGTKEAVDRCRKHPFMRAFRPGRLVYTALEATLRLYLDGEEEATQRVPSLRRLFSSPLDLERRARLLADQLTTIDGVSATVIECTSQAGSGALPAREFPSWGVQVSAHGETAATLARRLRTGEPSLLARVQDGALLLDARTIEEDEIPLAVKALRTLA